MSLSLWPPVKWLWDQYRTDAAWYSGDPEQLAQNTAGFWKTAEKTKVHIPIAGDIASLAAGMLFCGSPTIKHEKEATNDRLQKILQKCGIYQKLLQASELQSPYGGVYLKWNWNQRKADYPLLRVVPADAGLPFYINGLLDSITFWSVIREDEDSTLWRTEEVYTSDGKITTKLRKGSLTLLGNEEPLTAIPEAAGIEAEIDSGTGMLLATYIPNRLPNKLKPYSPYGRSDYQGLRTLFSALDEAYSSMMRDIKLGKTVIIVPANFLRAKSRIFDAIDTYNAQNPAAPQFAYALSDEVFVAMDYEPEAASGTDIVPHQPLIRAEDHLKVIADIVGKIIMLAGYSPQSEGIDIKGQAESGTALNVRERRSMQTTETKKTYWWHALVDMVTAGLALDKAIFTKSLDLTGDITVAFADNSQPDLQTIADVLDKLERAGAISTQTKVEILHPDWDEDAVNEEVARIKEERGLLQEEEDEGLGDNETNPKGDMTNPAKPKAAKTNPQEGE